MNLSFYRAFEDRYRGARELIKGRQKVYLPFILPLKEAYPECPALDLGCGRGEWLEILLENGFQPKGVDLDEGMLQECRVLKLPAEQGEALDALKRLPDESLVVVSGFHIAEHIPFDDLRQLVSEALRVLKPAGLLILETPNAENLMVGAHSFYLDPTHERPIPHLLLSFLVEYAGFIRFKLLRLQEDPEVAQADQPDLKGVLCGASPDYAIVAQKASASEKMVLFDQAFEQEYGVALDVLASRYDQILRGKFNFLDGKLDCMSQSLDGKLDCMSQQIRQLVDQLQEQLKEAMQSFHRAEARCQTAESALREQIGRAAHAEAKLAATQEFIGLLSKQEQQASAKAEQAEIRAQESAAKVADAEAELLQVKSVADRHSGQLQAVLASTSWQLTQPVRAAGILLKGRWRAPKCGVRLAVKHRLKQLVSYILQKAAQNPRIRRRAIGYLARRPVLKARLKRIAWSCQDISYSASQLSAEGVGVGVGAGFEVVTQEKQGVGFRVKGINDGDKSPLESYFY